MVQICRDESTIGVTCYHSFESYRPVVIQTSLLKLSKALVGKSSCPPEATFDNVPSSGISPAHIRGDGDGVGHTGEYIFVAEMEADVAFLRRKTTVGRNIRVY